MENIQLLMHGFSTLFTFSNVGAALLGAVLGLVVGAMPGIGREQIRRKVIRSR